MSILACRVCNFDVIAILTSKVYCTMGQFAFGLGCRGAKSPIKSSNPIGWRFGTSATVARVTGGLGVGLRWCQISNQWNSNF